MGAQHRECRKCLRIIPFKTVVRYMNLFEKRKGKTGHPHFQQGPAFSTVRGVLSAAHLSRTWAKPLTVPPHPWPHRDPRIQPARLTGGCCLPLLMAAWTQAWVACRAVAMGSGCIGPTVSGNSSFPGLILSLFSRIPASARPGAETDAESLAAARGPLPTSPHLWPPQPVTSAPGPDLLSHGPSLCRSGTCRAAEQQGSATVECMALRPARES